MPELPEVETIVRQLKSKVLYRTITNLDILDKKVIDNRINKLLPAKIEDVYRRGKSIVIQLDKGNLLIHLRMTGHFYYITDKNDNSYKKYLSGIFKLDNESFLTFNEIRRFGSVRFFSDNDLNRELSKLGPEPLVISKYGFVQRLKENPNAAIKTKLLDQTCLAGIGNIYAQEALYYSGINPCRSIKEVPDNSLRRLHQEVKKILRLAIENNGTTVDNFSHLTGKGNFQNFLAVYDQPLCPKNHSIEKIKVSGRGTSFCSKCQK